MRNPMTRRTMLKYTGLTTAIAGAAPLVPGLQPTQPPTPGPQIDDLGSGNVAYPLMSAILVDSRFYIGSRNLEPTRALAYDPASRTVVASATFGPGEFVQSLAHDPGSNVLYAGIVKNSVGEPNVYAWDLDTDQVSAVATIDSLKAVRALAVAPDGTLYATGRERGSAGPAIYSIDVATGAHSVLTTPDPNATQARGLAVTDTHVYFGAGSNLAGGGDASPATVFAVDRSTGAATSLIPADAPFATDPAARDLAVFGDKLYVGTEGSTESGWFAVFSLSDYSLEFSAQMAFKTVKKFIEADGSIYFDSGGLQSYDPQTQTHTTMPGGGSVGGWGLGCLDGEILAASSAQQAVVHYDLATGETASVDLITAGAPGDAQLGMSLAADRSHAYVGGNGSVDLHDLRTGDSTKVFIPSEAKDMLVHRGRLLAGVYSSQGVWAYDPRENSGPARVVELPQEQNRPQSLSWDESLSRLLVGTQADTVGGGALIVCDVQSGEAEVHVNPLPGGQMVRAVTSHAGRAYIGGEHTGGSGNPRGHLAAWDLRRERELWHLDPGLDDGISGLTVHGHKLFAVTIDGTLLVVDRLRGTLQDTIDLRPVGSGRARLLTSEGRVFGGSAHGVFMVHPASHTVTTVVDGLDGQWYSGPRLAADATGALYTLRERNLIRIRNARQAH